MQRSKNEQNQPADPNKILMVNIYEESKGWYWDAWDWYKDKFNQYPISVGILTALAITIVVASIAASIVFSAGAAAPIAFGAGVIGSAITGGALTGFSAVAIGGAIIGAGLAVTGAITGAIVGAVVKGRNTIADGFRKMASWFGGQQLSKNKDKDEFDKDESNFSGHSKKLFQDLCNKQVRQDEMKRQESLGTSWKFAGDDYYSGEESFPNSVEETLTFGNKSGSSKLFSQGRTDSDSNSDDDSDSNSDDAEKSNRYKKNKKTK